MSTAEDAANAPDANPTEDDATGVVTPEDFAKVRGDIAGLKLMMEELMARLPGNPAEPDAPPEPDAAEASETVTAKMTAMEAAFNKQQETIDALRSEMDEPQRRSSPSNTDAQKTPFESARANFGKWYLAQRGVRTGEIGKDESGNWGYTGVN